MSSKSNTMARYLFAAPFLFGLLAGFISSCGPYKKHPGSPTHTQETTIASGHVDLPLPVGARITEQSHLPLGPHEASGYQIWLKAYSVHSSIESLSQFYRTHLELHGWHVEPLIATSTMLCLSAHMPHKRCMVLIEPAGRKKNSSQTTQITLCVRENHA